jgi:predicted  nucleic acid-binding Zn-ribbon protein
LGDQESAADTVAALQKELANEQQAQEEARKDVETLARAIDEPKKTVDQFSTHVPTLEAQVKTLNKTIMDVTTAKELILGHHTTAKDSF